MRVDVIVLNGGSSSSKSSLARCLQELLEPTWLTVGVDGLIRALPGGGTTSIGLGDDGSVTVNDDFRRAEASWYQGLAAIARCGTGLIIDEVFLDGRTSQDRLRRALSDLSVLWVGVRCDPDVASERERRRADRVPGMARRQAAQVHVDVDYDIAVETSGASSLECAQQVIAYLRAIVPP